MGRTSVAKCNIVVQSKYFRIFYDQSPNSKAWIPFLVHRVQGLSILQDSILYNLCKSYSESLNLIMANSQ
jgi:hypothetical protein